MCLRQGARPQALAELRRGPGRAAARALASSSRGVRATARARVLRRRASRRPRRRRHRRRTSTSRACCRRCPRSRTSLDCRQRRAGDPADQRAAHPGAARRRLRHPLRALRARSVVRLRVDGTLRDRGRAARARCTRAIVSRIKIMAQLDIAEKRLPQDGRIALRVAGKPVDVRVSTHAHRPRRARRCCACSTSKRAGSTSAPSAWTRPTLAHVDTLIKQPHGIVLVTGPTGSGKTTTLYAALARLDSLGAQHHDRRGPDRVRARRHHPDPGQPRDRHDLRARAARRSCARTRTSSWSARSATWRPPRSRCRRASPATSCSPRCTPTTRRARVTRLVDMGVEPYLLSSSLLGVLAQRLVRSCARCNCRTTRARPTSPSSASARRRLSRAGRLRRLQQHRLRRTHRHLRAAGDRRRREAA